MNNLHALLLEDLAGLVAGVGEDGFSRDVLAAVVDDLERLAGAELGGGHDVVVVLVRRFARAHRLLLRVDQLPCDAAERLQRHLVAMRDPFAAVVGVSSQQQGAFADARELVVPRG